MSAEGQRMTACSVISEICVPRARIRPFCVCVTLCRVYLATHKVVWPLFLCRYWGEGGHSSALPFTWEFFPRKHKNIYIYIHIYIHKYIYIYIYTIYSISPDWNDTGKLNLSSCKPMACQFYIANILGVNVLATQGAMASAIMLLTVLNRNNSPHVKG